MATKSDLISLGRKYKNDSILAEEAAYKEGIKIFVPNIEHLKKLLEEDRELKDNCVVVVSNKSNDGASGLNAHAEIIEGVKYSSLDGTRQTIYFLSDAIFSSNEKDLKYFLGKGVDNVDEIKRKCRNLKPCIHGSDAHSNEKIFEPDQKRYCWIKADPTFEGFKQIIFEPYSRIRIQEDKPEQKRPYLYIDKVRFISQASDLTFSNESIEVNPNLNCIIGGKSSGKSLLLYYVAKTIDHSQIENKYRDLEVSDSYSFEEDITDFDFELVWGDGVTFNLSDSASTKNRQITYIPQMYINHLAEKRGNDKLKNLIQSILEEKPEFHEFHNSAKNDISRFKLLTENKISQYFEFEKKIGEAEIQLKNKGDKSARQKNLTNRQVELAALRIESGFTEEQEKDYSNQLSLRGLHESRRKNLENAKEVLSNEYSLELNTIEEEIRARLIGIAEITSPKFANSEKTKNAYSNTIKKYEEELLAPFQKVYIDIAIKIEKIDRCVQKCLEKISIYDLKLAPYLAKITKKEKLQEIQQDIAQEESMLFQITELEQQEAVLKKQMNDYKLEAEEGYEKTIKEYQKIIEKINHEYSDINSDRNIKLKARLTFDSDSFFNSCTRHVNKQTSLSSFGNYFDLNEFVFIENTHFDNIKDFFSKILEADIRYNQGGNKSVVCSAMLEDYFSIDFEIFEMDESIFKMSPGKKGLILLYLILHLSNASYPILIDQPEDNLDNRTVYRELKDFIKLKKIERQILIVTHNANLVVPTDSENVIVANQSGQDKGKDNAIYRFEYISGSLENSFVDKYAIGILNQMGIREHVCEILEGGVEAFKEREIRYSIA